MLAGPGRQILVDGWRAASKWNPDMNSLVALGACSSFAVSCAAAALPSLGWRTFFEEPAMLLGVVLVGRALEERAKLQASSDMTSLQVVAMAAEVSMHRKFAYECILQLWIRRQRTMFCQLSDCASRCDICYISAEAKTPKYAPGLPSRSHHVAGGNSATQHGSCSHAAG